MIGKREKVREGATIAGKGTKIYGRRTTKGVGIEVRCTEETGGISV